jgi:integrase
MPKIGKRVVDASAASEQRYYVWDDELKGFGLLVLPTGIKSYFYQYRTPEGRQRRATIGKHGDWTPTQAREKAEEYRDIVRKGGDPLAERRALQESPTVNDLLDAYLESESFKEKATSTKAIDRGRIERHLRPLLGRKHVHLVTSNDVKRALAAIRDGKTYADVKTGKRGLARVRGGDGAARMAIDLLRAVFNWAGPRGEQLIKSNPCADVRTGASGTRETILEDAADYARLFQTLDRMEHEKRVRPPAADAIRLIALTGCRRGEAAGLLWQHVDLKQGRIVLPSSAHKTGRKTGKPRVIGLPAVAQAIIAKQPKGRPTDFVFAAARGDGALALSKIWRKIRTEADLPPDIGLHGLRHSLASHMAMSGAQASEIMTALGHRQMSTAQRYVHWAENARQKLAEKAATVVLAGLAASIDTEPADVLTMKGRKP